jgi:HAD superfamily hydrolase (TIGR01549 family)
VKSPRAILLDFGGVLVDVIHCDGELVEVAAEVQELLVTAGADFLERPRIAEDLRAGWQAYQNWKKAQVRRPFPLEIGHREFWEELVAGDWPAASRDVVGRHASGLCQRLDLATLDRPPRNGALELLRRLAEMDLPVGLVSNALGGAGSRMLMRRHGFEPYVRVQVYSDEVCMRKPNPGIFEWAARSLGVSLGDCWYVGDTLDRDVLGARRAGVGRVLLMPSDETKPDGDLVAAPDEIVRRPVDIHDLLTQVAR